MKHHHLVEGTGYTLAAIDYIVSLHVEERCAQLGAHFGYAIGVRVV